VGWCRSAGHGLIIGVLSGATLGVVPGHSTVESCQGRQATIVGAPSGEEEPPLAGTSGPDVIVTNGAALTLAGAGDDLICVTAPLTPGFFWVLDVVAGSGNDTVLAVGSAIAVDGITQIQGNIGFHAGDGDDVVVATASGWGVNGALGEGADEFRGGPTLSDVFAGDDVTDTERDVLRMGEGSDIVHTGQASLSNPDLVELGPGRDGVAWMGSSLAAGGTLDGGAGRDAVDLDPAPGDWVVDNRIGSATHDQRPELQWSGMEDFYISIAELGDRTLTFLGASVDEKLSLYDDGTRRPGGVHIVDLGAGDDRFDSKTGGAEGSNYAGGEGRDSLMIGSPFARLTIDLARRRLDLGSSLGPLPEAVVTGFEKAHGLPRDVTLGS
jgi:hypothetical protein